MNDSIIRINRDIRPDYETWMTPVNPILDRTGPSEYDIRGVGQYLHHKQQHVCSELDIQEIYTYLEKSMLLENCLGLADLLAIKERGAKFFEYLLRGKKEGEVKQVSDSFYGWKSVFRVRDSDQLSVPYVCLNGNQYVNRISIYSHNFRDRRFCTSNVTLFFDDPEAVLLRRRNWFFRQIHHSGSEELIFRKIS